MDKREKFKPGAIVMINPLVKVGQDFKYGPKKSGTITLNKSMIFEGERRISSLHSDEYWDVISLEGNNTYYQADMLCTRDDYLPANNK